MEYKTENSKSMTANGCIRLDELPKEIKVIKASQFDDKRGFLRCLYEDEAQEEFLLSILKLSYSKKNVARGIHWQRLSRPQSKLITVLEGKIVDILVNMDNKSPFFCKVYKVVLDSTEPTCLLIPPTYAHGFLALENTTFLYACAGSYSESSELSISICEHIEPFINESLLILSEKDKAATTLKNIRKKLE